MTLQAGAKGAVARRRARAARAAALIVQAAARGMIARRSLQLSMRAVLAMAAAARRWAARRRFRTAMRAVLTLQVRSPLISLTTSPCVATCLGRSLTVAAKNVDTPDLDAISPRTSTSSRGPAIITLGCPVSHHRRERAA